jgi:hypothetical protein
MHATTPQQVNLSSDGNDSRERSRSGATAQPEPASQYQSGDAPRADLHPSAAESTNELRDAVYEVLGCAFRSAPDGRSTNGMDDRTTDAVREVCAMARATDVRAETLILAIKGVWRQLPEAHGMTRLDAEVTLAALITLCIKEYYVPQPRR